MAPAGGARNPALGRPLVAVRPHYGGLPFSGLDAARTKAGESLPDRGPTRAPSAPESYGPGEQKSPRWSAERRPRSSQEGRGKTEEGSAAWRSIPSPAEGNESKPRRARGILSPATGHPPPRTKPRREKENACLKTIRRHSGARVARTRNPEPKNRRRLSPLDSGFAAFSRAPE